MLRYCFPLRLRARACVAILTASSALSCTSRAHAPTLAGDWDAYVALGSTARSGFEGWRRMGFAHFDANDSGASGAIRRRTGESIFDVKRVVLHADSVELANDSQS